MAYIWCGKSKKNMSIESRLGVLCEVYKQLVETGDLPEEIWDEWLWRTNPEEPHAHDVLMNRSQLLGFLVCLFKGMQPFCACGAMPERLSVMDKPVQEMSLRELKDTIENIQIEWPEFLKRLDHNPNAQKNLDAVMVLIDQCAGRFGALCLKTWDETVLDDLACVEGVPGKLRVTQACIRRTVCTFLIIYRHIHLLAVCKTIPGAWVECGITKYHMEASTDDFHLLCMHMALPVAAKLNYRHDFPGMFNHVSQAVFFHNSEYQRSPRVSLENLKGAGAEQLLPALMQLHPSIGIRYEEDVMDLSDSILSDGGGWFWLVVPCRVYLVDPAKVVWYSSDVTSLLRIYLERSEAEK